MNKLEKLATLTAFILTGGRVVRFQFVDSGDMPLSRCRGLFFRDGDNGVVLVRSGLDPEQRVRTLLHETAHAALDWHITMDIKHVGRLSGRYRSEVPTIPKAYEDRTSKMAGVWVDMAETLVPGGSCSEKLAALSRFYLRGKTA